MSLYRFGGIVTYNLIILANSLVSLRCLLLLLVWRRAKAVLEKVKIGNNMFLLRALRDFHE